MNKKAIFISLISFVCNVTAAQQGHFVTQSPSADPLREVRAVWLTTLRGLDWPRTHALSEATAARQRDELCATLDRLQRAGINTVMFQTRIRATAAYASALEPWDGAFTGTPGKSPGYDPLAFAVAECHRRGMQLHAWVVAIPLGKWKGEGCVNLRKRLPRLVKKIGDEGFLNPEQPATADYLAQLCADITRRYDIDGLHLDYIRYPDRWKNIGRRDRARDNITRIVRSVSRAVKAEKRWVQMSCAPVGKYADTRRQSSLGWNARDAVAQDAVEWLREGLMDALYPMMYFRDEHFYPFAIDWQERSGGKTIVPGLGIYFLNPREGKWVIDDVTREMHVTRQYGMGMAMFRSKFLTDNTQGLYDYTREAYSRYPALPVAMTWLHDELPLPPQDVRLETDASDNVCLRWTAPADTMEHDGGVRYNVYADMTTPVDTRTAANLIAAAVETTAITMPRSAAAYHFAVTTIDRYGNESVARQLSTGTAAALTLPTMALASLPLRGETLLLDSADVAVGDVVEIVSIMGSGVRTAVVQRDGDHRVVRTGPLTVGRYRAYSINRKGFRHLLGWFEK